MTTETIPSYLVPPNAADVATTTLALRLGEMLLTAVSTATIPLVDRVHELEAKVAQLENFQAELDDHIENLIECALDNLSIEVSAELKNKFYKP